jgi:hypothetical protein
MGTNNGPVGQGLENVVIRVDLYDSKSYTGTGNTINSVIKQESLSSSAIGYTVVGSEKALVFAGGAGAGFVTSFSNTGVSGTQSRTMSCWVKLGSKSSQGCVATGANGSGTGMAIAASSTVFILATGNSGILTTITYNQNQWYHLTYVSEFVTGSTHRLKFYVNGGIAHSAVASSINLTNAPLRIGMDMSGFGMSGQIARVNFYDKALSDKEIFKTYVNYRSRFGL